LHWALAVPFMVCYTTALILVLVYNPSPLRPYRAVFSWAHRISGVCLLVLPLWTIARHWREFTIHWQNILEAWLWRLDDVKWLFLMGPSTLNKKISLPDSGKFNAAEKLNFMMLNCTYPFYIVTGFLIWLPGVAYMSWLVHLSMAAVATPLILGHVFMATVNPDTRVGLSGMISGFVNRRWARHHYRRWYDENFAPGVARAALGADAAPAQPRPVVVLHRPSLGGLAAASWPPLRHAAVGTGLAAGQRADADIAGAPAIAGSAGQGGILRELEVDDPSLMADDNETPAARWPQVRQQARRATIARIVPPNRPVLGTGSLVRE
jgi:formate dehydrogenase gamma subunit